MYLGRKIFGPKTVESTFFLHFQEHLRRGPKIECILVIVVIKITRNPVALQKNLVRLEREWNATQELTK